MSLEKAEYRLVSSIDFERENPSEVHCTQGGRSSRLRRILWPAVFATLTIIVVIQSVAIIILSRNTRDSCLSIHGMPLQRTEPRTIYQHSKYISSDEQVASKAWEDILPGHGVVAIERDYAVSKKLPETIILPESDGKSLYVIEAYHAMHCVVNLRKHYTSLQHNDTWNWSHGHDLHCFDALRQYIMCNIDDTLLHTWGKRDAGHDQQKMCHDWDRLRGWAEERSASYFDVEPGMGIRHIGNYHEGDGLPAGSLS